MFNKYFILSQFLIKTERMLFQIPSSTSWRPPVPPWRPPLRPRKIFLCLYVQILYIYFIFYIYVNIVFYLKRFSTQFLLSF